MEEPFNAQVAAVQRIKAVSNILNIVCRLTGMGFAAVARVTEDRWIACQVQDNIQFGLPAGGELKVETTLCHEVRQLREVIVFDHADEDPAFSGHHTPRIYGLQSYISVPIILSDGQFFGTLCAIDPAPHKVNTPEIVGTFQLFAELIANQLSIDEQLDRSLAQLADARKVGELRDQFIAVLGHDLRNPLAALDSGINLLNRGWNEKSPAILQSMKASVSRSQALIDNVMDFARTKLGDGISLELTDRDIRTTMMQIVDEVRFAHPQRKIETAFDLSTSDVKADHPRLAQMFGNLLANAITHGAADKPIKVSAAADDKELTVRVLNSAPAIDASALAELFKPFFRVDGKSRKGLGLGLFIASEIAQAHDGTLSVASNDGQVEFVFRMPL